MMADMEKFKPQYEEVLVKADDLQASDHFASESIEKAKDKLIERWEKLERAGRTRDKTLDKSIRAHEYFMEANEVEHWLKERQDNLAACASLPWPKNVDALMVRIIF